MFLTFFLNISERNISKQVATNVHQQYDELTGAGIQGRWEKNRSRDKEEMGE